MPIATASTSNIAPTNRLNPVMVTDFTRRDPANDPTNAAAVAAAINPHPFPRSSTSIALTLAVPRTARIAAAA